MPQARPNSCFDYAKLRHHHGQKREQKRTIRTNGLSPRPGILVNAYDEGGERVILTGFTKNRKLALLPTGLVNIRLRHVVH